MLSAKAVACAAAAACAAAYVQTRGVPAFVRGWFVPPAVAEAQLRQLYRPADNLLLRAVGYAALALFGYAWCFWVVAALAAAWQRYRYVPIGTTTRPPPAPGMQEGGAGGEQQPHTPAAAAVATPAATPQQRVAPRAAAAAAVAARTPAPPTPQPQPEQRQQGPQLGAAAAGAGDPHDAARRRALEAAQRALDAQAAAQKAQRDQQEAERRARLAATAAAAEAAAAAAARQAPPPAAAPAGTQASSSAAAAADQDSLATARQLRAEQDWEFQQSLAADRARGEQRSAAAREQQRRADEQQRLTALRQRLQAELPPEPAQGGQDGSAVSIRVRLPDGSHAGRRFAKADDLCAVYDWVFSLPAMPLLRPGSWSLASSWPRQRLAPAPAGGGSSSVWVAGGWAREVAAHQQREALAPGEWLLEVRQVAGEQVAVRVSEASTIADVKQALQEQTGLAAIEQRLIFSGRVLSTPGSSLAQLGIGPGHVLQLAPRTSSSGSATRDSDSSGQVDAAASSAASGESSGDGLALATVGDLADHVGSAQLALFVAVEQ